MIAIDLIRNNPELVKENIKKKFQDSKLPLVDEVLELDKKLREIKQEGNNLRGERNTLSAKVGALMKEKNIEEANKVKDTVKSINDRIVECEKLESEIQEKVTSIMMVTM